MSEGGDKDSESGIYLKEQTRIICIQP